MRKQFGKASRQMAPMRPWGQHDNDPMTAALEKLEEANKDPLSPLGHWMAENGLAFWRVLVDERTDELNHM